MSSGNGSRFWGTVLALGLVGMGLVFVVGMTEEARRISNPTPVFGIVVVGIIFTVMLRGPIGRSIGKMLEGSGASDDGLRDRVEDLEIRLGEPSYDQQRIQELEERLDFAERLLAQRSDQQVLPPRDR